jgi:hypothetical protein
LDLSEFFGPQEANKKSAILLEILPALEDAVEFSERGEWEKEVVALGAALEIAKSNSFLRGSSVYTSARIKLVDAGLIFRGAEIVGDVWPLTGSQLMQQKQSVFAGLTHLKDQTISVFTDRVICGEQVRPIDKFTTASVFLDGQEQVIQRPTLTRMALLSPLPGIALMPGLALQKKSKIDSREVTFSIASAEWQFTCRTQPTGFSSAKAIAERVNAIAAKLEGEVQPSKTSTSALDELQKLKTLLDSGAVNQAEYDSIKSKLLENL